MKLSKEETKFIYQVLQEESKPHFDVCLEEKHASQLKLWLHTLRQATDIQVVAKVNSEVVYFPAHLHTSEAGLPTFSCDLPNIFAAQSSNRHWITKRLTGIVLKSDTVSTPFNVLSLSLSGLVIRTHPFMAISLYDALTQGKVTLHLPNNRSAQFEVDISKIVNDTTVSLEIMDIHEGLEELKQVIFELYSKNLA
ncbi:MULTISPECIES: hypothetical protein [Pseudoalteromonas]|uniref:Uncharacterized protein n=1 Tax=Pseudoalteromonas amylolytica TaxID=1859457 RepID=A0A1S1MWY1_9GAMM|nr:MULTISPECIES: hypothetical protein [Pseudoalteromonas]OHU88137.1 hypothetical protein BFC16_12160 [Pseudoalteromonas sp. JW3]OHU91577.1 hypothetical protein BET10_12280 [Pseudoalteromonas amylolytica]